VIDPSARLLDVLAPIELLPTLAHAGAGSTWQAMTVVAGIVLAGYLVAAGVGKVALDTPDDLVVPLAAAAIASSLGALAHAVISDAVGWGLPLAVVSALGLVLAATTPLDVRFPAPLPMATVALAIVSGVVLYGPLTIALHPPAELVPLSDDAAVIITEPADGSTVDTGEVAVAVRVDGGSIGPGDLLPDELPTDPEQAAALDIVVERTDVEPPDRRVVDVDYDRDCTLDAPCDEVGFVLALEPGTYEITTDLARGDGVLLSPIVRDRITIRVR
jgi:hypothetical protein